VSASHWNTTDQTICAKARVSIASTRRKPDAEPAEDEGAEGGEQRREQSEASIGRPSAFTHEAAPYAPRPK
jgi:hypothetical protein